MPSFRATDTTVGTNDDLRDDRVPFRQGRGPVDGTVIDHDDLIRLPNLIRKRIEGLRQKGGGIKSWNDDADPHAYLP
jgi:hypothetical protein